MSLGRFYRPAAVALAVAWITVNSMGSTVIAAPATPQQVSQFLANPAALLQANPNGGGTLVAAIRDLLLGDPNTLTSIMSLLASANPDQKAAIGSGAGQAAQASLRANPQFATQIQQALASSGDQTAIAAYSSVTGNTVTAAGGGGGGGGGGGVGGPIGGGGPPSGGGGSGGSSNNNAQGFPNPGLTFFPGGTVGNGSGAGGGPTSPR